MSEQRTDQDVGRSFLPDMLACHHERHPRIGIEVTEGRSADIMKLVRKGQLDIAFVIGALKAEDCHSRLLWSEALMAVLPANQPLAEHPTITWGTSQSKPSLSGMVELARKRTTM